MSNQSKQGPSVSNLEQCQLCKSNDHEWTKCSRVKELIDNFLPMQNKIKGLEQRLSIASELLSIKCAEVRRQEQEFVETKLAMNKLSDANRDLVTKLTTVKRSLGLVRAFIDFNVPEVDVLPITESEDEFLEECMSQLSTKQSTSQKK